MEEGANFHDRPALDIVIRKFRAAKLTAYVAGLLFTILFVCIWPGSMLRYLFVLSFFKEKCLFKGIIHEKKLSVASLQFSIHISICVHLLRFQLGVI